MKYCNALRSVCAALLLSAFAVLPAFAQAPPCALLPPSATSDDGSTPCLPPLTPKERLKDYARWTIGPEALLGTAMTSGIAQARNHPSAWEQGMAGYGRRYAHRVGKNIVSNTVRLGVESAFGLDSRYYPSPRRAFGSRIAHIIRTTFLARTPQGNETLAVGRIAGAFTGGLVSRQWQPDGHDSIGDGFQSGAISFGTDFAAHAFEEFWPDVRKRLPF